MGHKNLGGDASVKPGLTALLLALFASVAVALLIAAPAASADGSAAVVTSPANEARSNPEPLWTKERMLAAKPLDVESEDPGVDTERGRAMSRAAGAGPEVLSSGATPFATVEPDKDVKDYLSYPSRAHGRIFATTPGVGDFTCSGTLVSSAGQNLVYTAGHCLYDKESNQFAVNVIFVPAYKQGTAPYDAYSATNLLVLDGWSNLDYPEAYSYDVAAMTLDQPLEQLIGARGIKVNVDPRGKGFDIFGYPARPNPPYNGENPIHCPKAKFQGTEDELYPVANPSIIAGPCYMMQGSSGGGWILSGGFVNSVVSHGFCDVEPQLCGLTHGPYFSDGAAALYNGAGGGKGKPTDSVFCKEPQAKLAKAKKAQKKAKKKLKKAKKQGKKSKVKKAKKKVKKANKNVKKAQKKSDEFLC